MYMALHCFLKAQKDFVLWSWRFIKESQSYVNISGKALLLWFTMICSTGFLKHDMRMFI